MVAWSALAVPSAFLQPSGQRRFQSVMCDCSCRVTHLPIPQVAVAAHPGSTRYPPRPSQTIVAEPACGSSARPTERPFLVGLGVGARLGTRDGAPAASSRASRLALHASHSPSGPGVPPQAHRSGCRPAGLDAGRRTPPRARRGHGPARAAARAARRRLRELVGTGRAALRLAPRRRGGDALASSRSVRLVRARRPGDGDRCHDPEHTTHAGATEGASCPPAPRSSATDWASSFSSRGRTPGRTARARPRLMSSHEYLL